MQQLRRVSHCLQRLPLLQAARKAGEGDDVGPRKLLQPLLHERCDERDGHQISRVRRHEVCHLQTGMRAVLDLGGEHLAH